MKIFDTWVMPIRTVSEANNADHWTKKKSRKYTQKTCVKAYFMQKKPKFPLPLKIMLIRRSPRKLDEGDNLPMSMKYVRDAIADNLIPGLAPGQADSSPLLKWDYDQEKSSEQGVKVIFFQD